MKRRLIPINKVLVLLIFLVSCKHTVECVYYDLYFIGDTYPSGSYRLCDDGRCLYLKYNRSTGEMHVFEVSDVMSSNNSKWSANNDTIVIEADTYKVFKLTNDSLMLKGVSSFAGRDMIFHKSRRQDDE